MRTPSNNHKMAQIKTHVSMQKSAAQQQKLRPLQNIMRKHAKAPNIQKRQSDLLMTYASNDHHAIARLIQAWLCE